MLSVQYGKARMAPFVLHLCPASITNYYFSANREKYNSLSIGQSIGRSGDHIRRTLLLIGLNLSSASCLFDLAVRLLPPIFAVTSCVLVGSWWPNALIRAQLHCLPVVQYRTSWSLIHSSSSWLAFGIQHLSNTSFLWKTVALNWETLLEIIVHWLPGGLQHTSILTPFDPSLHSIELLSSIVVYIESWRRKSQL